MPGTGVRGATLFTRRCPTQFRRRCSLRQLASSAAQQQQQAAVVAVDNPYSGETYARTPELDATELLARARSAAEAQKVWGRTPLSQRVDICSGAIEWFQANADAIAADISGMMGKPRHHARGEIGGLEERARHMMVSAAALF
jgi:acyl-CoA reductase-like NAD-dependent aldehyde dehydrogenase